MLTPIRLANNKIVIPKLMILDKEELVCMKLQDYQRLARHLWENKVLIGLLLKGGSNIENLEEVVKGEKMVPEEKTDTQKDRIPEELIEEAAKVLEKEKKEDFVGLGDYLRQITVDSIRKARKDRGLTQQELARRAHLKQSQVSRIERDPKHASLKALQKLAKVLNVDIVIPVQNAQTNPVSMGTD